MNDNDGMDYPEFREAQIQWRRWLASEQGQREMARIRRREAAREAFKFALQGAGWVLVATVVAAMLTVLMAW